MNTQLFTRITQIKEYINNVKDSLAEKDHQNVSVIVSKFKNIILKEDAEQYAYQCILDTLQAKNQKLQQELIQVKEEKQQFELEIQKKKNRSKQMKETKVQFFLTRLTVSLNDCKKVQYREALIHSDYNTIFINSINSTKYVNYPISVKSIESSQCKTNYMHLSWGKQQKINLIIRFYNQKDAQKWSMCLKLAEIIVKNKNEINLFQKQLKQEQKKKEEANKISSLVKVHLNNHNNQNIASISHAPASIQVPLLNLNNPLFAFHKNSPSESMISDRRSFDKAGQKSQEKDTQRSLVNAMSSHSINHMNYRYNNRFQSKKPALIKTRGLSDHLDNNFQLSRMYKNNHPRKQSDDIFRPKINQLYHQKMLEKLKVRDREDQNQIQSIQTRKLQDQDKQIQQSANLQILQKKKKDILNQMHRLPVQKQQKQSSFGFDAKVNWGGVHIQQLEDEQKSKSSNNRDSRISSIVNGSDDDKMKQYDDKNLKISEKSLEESPRLPINSPTNGHKNGNYEAPQKISYSDGHVFRLIPVQKSQQKDNHIKTIVTFKQQILQHQKQSFQEAQSKVQSDSQSAGSDEHSNPSTHQNHTESEDNNGRAEQLKKGIFVTKCSQNGFWTHEKILYLSQNENQLCSRDLKDKKIKKIKLSNIKQVQYKAYYKGIIKHISKVEDDKCLVIQALAEDNEIKNYEYVGNLVEPLERFATSLKLFVQYYKRQ